MQAINVYNPKYESRAAFWPDLPGRVITALIISQILLMGLLSTKHAAASTLVLLALLALTMGFHIYCKGRFEPAFTRYPLHRKL
ncbi:putative calcium-dependent channel, 7TM region phosphate [Helianthus annuus]|nr:putative calcium-dependent channel, 7TM region phosphate [Helianthus annuus]